MNATKEQMTTKFEPYIAKCRPGDWEHAKRVVAWIEVLGSGRSDLSLLIMAGYIHDIGWSGIVPVGEKLTREELIKLQPLADVNTEKLVSQATTLFRLSKEELLTLLRLIRATETYVSTQDDEAVVVDADNLSKTDPDHVKEKYKREEWLNMCSLFEEKLPLRIKTEKGKSLFSQKLAELRKSLEKELA